MQLENKYPYTEKFCQKYLSEDQDSAADIIASVSEEEFLEERTLSLNYSDGYIENIFLYRSLCLQIPQRNRLLLHASVLDFNGSGYAFLGRSGTGKSTHTRLWLQYLSNTFVVNGDKPFLQETADCFIAYGPPWQGKEGWGAKTEAPLRGLCFMERGTENRIRRLAPAEAVDRVFRQMLKPKDAAGVAETLRLADLMIRKIPVYLLSCNISEDAARLSFETMTEEK